LLWHKVEHVTSLKPGI